MVVEVLLFIYCSKYSSLKVSNRIKNRLLIGTCPQILGLGHFLLVGYEGVLIKPKRKIDGLLKKNLQVSHFICLTQLQSILQSFQVVSLQLVVVMYLMVCHRKF